MEVSKKSWHMRVYLWWYSHKYSTDANYKTSTNLCPYMRVVLFWAPLRFIFWDWVKLLTYTDEKGGKLYLSLNMLTTPASIYIIPKLAGYVSYDLKVGLWIVYAAVALTSIAMLMVAIGIHVVGKWKNKPREVKPPSVFWSLIKARAQANHDRVCPEIQITD